MWWYRGILQITLAAEFCKRLLLEMSTYIIPTAPTKSNNSIILDEDAQSKSPFPLLMSRGYHKE